MTTEAESADRIYADLAEMGDRARQEAAFVSVHEIAAGMTPACLDLIRAVKALEAVMVATGNLGGDALEATNALLEDRMWVRQECADLIRETIAVALAEELNVP